MQLNPSSNSSSIRYFVSPVTLREIRSSDHRQGLLRCAQGAEPANVRPP